MQSTFPAEPVPSTERVRAVAVPMEWLVYVVLIVGMVALRFAELDTAPMSDVEASQALIAWDAVYGRDAAVARPSDQPLTFYAQVLGLSTGSTGETGARAGGAVAGVALALLALLFRRRIGRVQTLLLTLLWGFSPVALAASRTSDPAIWSAMFGVLALWAGWNFHERRRIVDGTAALVFVCILVFLSGPYGLMAALILAAALAVSVYLTALNAPIDEQRPGEEVLEAARAAFWELPFRRGLGLGVLLVVLTATAFLLQPDGLTMVGASLESALRGLTQPPLGPAVPAPALLAVALYELGAVVLGIGGYILLQRFERVHFADRFALMVVVIAALVALLYRGAGPGFALFMALPLGWLCARVVARMLVDESAITYWDLVSDSAAVSEARHGWVKWMLALVLIGLLAMIGTHWQEVARSLLSFSPAVSLFDNLPRFFTFPSNGVRSLVWVVMSLLFTVVGAFLVASIWGNRITLQGVALGLFGFTLVSGVGGGWNAVVVRAHQPVEIWQASYVQPNAQLLRETLHEVARFTARGEPVLRVAVVQDPDIGLVNDGVVGWLLREFRYARFVQSIPEAAREEIIIARRTAEEIDLGGSYVGQSFTLRRGQQLLNVPVYDWAAWLAQRRTRDMTPARDSVILWVRLDLYNSVPVDLAQRR
ncbi:glycosyltransferase family 39 protein [Aggregatilineales bacterium SYSU G02658]